MDLLEAAGAEQSTPVAGFGEDATGVYPYKGRPTKKGTDPVPSALFSPLTLRGLTLDNRVAVSPMCQYNAEDGSANDWHLMHLGQFAMGAAGLVFAEATHVSALGRISPKCLGLYSDDNEAMLGVVSKRAPRGFSTRLASASMNIGSIARCSIDSMATTWSKH